MASAYEIRDISGMIQGPIVTTPPITAPGIVWREARFAVADVLGLEHEGTRIALPETLHRAVAKRRCEFLAGRLCAALALRAAGLPEFVGQQGRTPVWPPGAVGSITHTASRAIAVVSTHHSALGIDCETVMEAARAENLAAIIATPTETAQRPEGLTPAEFLTLIFSAKEALYKALSPQMREMPGFLDVTLTGTAPNQLHLTLGPHHLTAHYALTGTDCVTLVTTP